MEPLGAAVVTAVAGKSRKGKTEFTAKLAIGGPDARAMDPPTSRQRRVFGTSRCRNVPTEVPTHEPIIKPRTIPAARKIEKASTDFSKKNLRNPRKVSAAVPQTPVTSSPGGMARDWVNNLNRKLNISPPSSAPNTSSQKTGQVDPKPRKSVCSLEKSPSNPKEDNIVASPVSSATGSTVKHWARSLNPKPNDGARALSAAGKKFYPEKATDLDPKPKTKGIYLPGTSMGNLMDDDEVVPQTPVASIPQNQNSAAPFAAEKPSTDEKTGEIYQKPKDEIKNLSDDDIVRLLTPADSYAEKPSSDDKTSGLELNPKKKKKKSVCFREKSPRLRRTDDSVIPQTPKASVPDGAVKPRRSGTPYRTAESCRSCRLDRLETASYWLIQIKIAESAGKHFVSAAFFRLAIESKAEPVRNLRVELRRYLGRHPHLSEHLEWKDVSLKYGVAKDGGGANCSVTRDIGLIQGDSRESIGEELGKRLAA